MRNELLQSRERLLSLEPTVQLFSSGLKRL